MWQYCWRTAVDASTRSSKHCCLYCHCSFAYGLSTSIHGNVCHLEGQKLLYPAGQFFAVMGTHADDGKVQAMMLAGTAAHQQTADHVLLQQ
jgi:hypothetical protein